MPFKHVWAYGSHFWESYIASPNSPNGGSNLRLPPPTPPAPPSYTHPLPIMCVIELQWLQYLKLVFLEIPNVTTWSVFQKVIFSFSREG